MKKQLLTIFAAASLLAGNLTAANLLTPVGIWPLCRINAGLAPGCASLVKGTESYMILMTPVYAETQSFRWVVRGVRELDGAAVEMTGWALVGQNPILYPGALIGATLEVTEFRRSDGQ